MAERIKIVVRCGKCGSNDVQVRAWVNPNDGNSFSMYYDDAELEKTETCYCGECGEWTKPVFERTEEPEADLLRCSTCGSSNLECQVWADPNHDNRFIRDEDNINYRSVCKYCGDETLFVKTSELMEDIEDWYTNHLWREDAEVISGLNPEDFSSEDEFDATCKKLWGARSVEEKIEIWRTLTHRTEE